MPWLDTTRICATCGAHARLFEPVSSSNILTVLMRVPSTGCIQLGKLIPWDDHPAQVYSQWLCIYHQPYTYELEDLTIGTFSAMLILIRMLLTLVSGFAKPIRWDMLSQMQLSWHATYDNPFFPRKSLGKDTDWTSLPPRHGIIE
jgi:hypothetical protein